MANISPGVYSKIIDLSTYVQRTPSAIGFIPIISELGPDNQLVFTNSQDFFLDFGLPNVNYAGKAYGGGPYIANSFLQESDSLYTVRVLPTDAAFSNLRLDGEITGELGVDGTANITSTSTAALNTDAELESNVTAISGACLVIYGVGRGEKYNEFQIKISENSNVQKEGIYVLDIYQRQLDNDPITDLASYGIIKTVEVSFDYRELDDSGESIFIEDVINRFSRYIRCYADQSVCLDAIANGADFSEPFVAGPVNLQNGTSGTLFDVNGDIDGTVATQILTQAYNGTLLKTDGNVMNEVLDKDNYYFTTVYDGGYPSDVKTSGIYTLVITRQDCIGICDNGDNTNVTAAIAMRVGTHTYNTKYMALYEPYNKIYDSFTGRDIWITPITHLAKAIPANNIQGEVWDTPVGANRGSIGTIKQLRFNPLQGDRDRLYLNQLNPIVKFSTGYTIWGQLTTQKKPSALQDLNVVYMVLYVKRALEQYTNNYIFDKNIGITWSSVKTEVSRFLKDVQNRLGLETFTIDVSATDYEKKTKQFHVDVTLTPIKLVEIINLNFYIL